MLAGVLGPSMQSQDAIELWLHPGDTIVYSGGVSHLVERSGSSQDDVRVVHLNGSLAQPHQIRPDPYGPARDLQHKTGRWSLFSNRWNVDRCITLLHGAPTYL